MTTDSQRITREELKSLFPVYDRGDVPLVEIPDLKRDILEMVASGDDVPFMAFVSGPNLNLRVEFIDYDAERHRLLPSMGLIELIRRGADRIVILSEVWFRMDDGTPRSHGVMILEATDGGDIVHTAEFEGRSLGAWVVSSDGQSGNLANLFARAKASPSRLMDEHFVE